MKVNWSELKSSFEEKKPLSSRKCRIRLNRKCGYVLSKVLDELNFTYSRLAITDSIRIEFFCDTSKDAEALWELFIEECNKIGLYPKHPTSANDFDVSKRFELPMG